MEIERKYLINTLPDNLNSYPFRIIEQGYLSTEPVVRIRRDNDDYILTYKSKGLMVREEYNLPLTPDSYEHLKEKIDGRLISKKRYMIPLSSKETTKIHSLEPLTGPDYIEREHAASGQPEPDLTIELDVFSGELAPLILAEVEFPDEESANNFVPPYWFGEDVTFSTKYHNSRLSQKECTK